MGLGASSPRLAGLHGEGRGWLARVVRRPVIDEVRGCARPPFVPRRRPPRREARHHPTPRPCRSSCELTRASRIDVRGVAVAQVAIKAESRSYFGKGAVRRTRRAGLVPAVIYGKGEEPRHVSLPDHDLTLALRHPGLVLEVELDGSKVLVAPRDVQRDPVKRVIEHVDLVLLSKSEAADRIEEGKAAEAALEAAHAAEAEAAESTHASAS
mgnify:CR=1 FL=1